jgi:hypothetical protein
MIKQATSNLNLTSVRFVQRSKLMTSAALCAALVLASACTTPTVRTDYDAKANIANYHSYSLEEATTRGGVERVFNNPLNQKRLRAAVESNLAAKGMRPAAAGASADCIVSISSGSREVVETEPRPAHWSMGWGWWQHGIGTSLAFSDDVYGYREHRISIDLLDAKTREPVWHVTAEEDINRLSGNSAEARINAVVAAMFAKYPGAGT